MEEGRQSRPAGAALRAAPPPAGPQLAKSPAQRAGHRQQEHQGQASGDPDNPPPQNVDAIGSN